MLERDGHIKNHVFAAILHDYVEVALLRDVPLYHEVLDVLHPGDDLGLVLWKFEPHEAHEELAEDRLQGDGLPLIFQKADVFRPVGADHELPLGHFTGPIKVHQDSVVTKLQTLHVQDGIVVLHEF